MHKDIVDIKIQSTQKHLQRKNTLPLSIVTCLTSLFVPQTQHAHKVSVLATASCAKHWLPTMNVGHYFQDL